MWNLWQLIELEFAAGVRRVCVPPEQTPYCKADWVKSAVISSRETTILKVKLN
jgi:hypothetical protein